MADVLLHAATAIAAFFQAVTGIGFGMLAGPVILIVLDDPAAVVIATLMSWLIAAVLFPFLVRGTDPRLLGRLLAGAALGLLPGLWLLGQADAAGLKLTAGLVIGSLTGLMMFRVPGVGRPGLAGDLAAGALAGLFGACLAMPGPTAAVRLAALGVPKARVRATMVSFFFAVWPVVFLGQIVARDIPPQTYARAAWLVPATLAGLALGNYAAARVGERVFRRLVLGFLLLTAAGLIGEALWRGMGGSA